MLESRPLRQWRGRAVGLPSAKPHQDRQHYAGYISRIYLGHGAAPKNSGCEIHPIDSRGRQRGRSWHRFGDHRERPAWIQPENRVGLQKQERYQAVLVWLSRHWERRFRFGWRVSARCAQGTRDGMRSIPECINRYELEMVTLLWTRAEFFAAAALGTAHVHPLRLARGGVTRRCAARAKRSESRVGRALRFRRLARFDLAMDFFWLIFEINKEGMVLPLKSDPP